VQKRQARKSKKTGKTVQKWQAKLCVKGYEGMQKIPAKG